ncbi:MAG: hypothetical protein IT545_11105 [Rhodobacteraceae bacterium]|nr:hypothetical protein [Paracoccaceae bacterium]
MAAELFRSFVLAPPAPPAALAALLRALSLARRAPPAFAARLLALPAPPAALAALLRALSRALCAPPAARAARLRSLSLALRAPPAALAALLLALPSPPAALAALLLALPAAPAAAAVALVRGGEHAGFTRLTVTIAPGAGWSLGRSPRGYGLVIAGAGVAIDLAEAFRRIDRRRVGGLAATGGRLDIALACPCHATAAEAAPDLLAIDIRDGPPPAGSPFERPLAAAAARPRPRPSPAAAVAGSGGVAGDPYLAAYWRRAGLSPPPVPATVAGRNRAGEKAPAAAAAAAADRGMGAGTATTPAPGEGGAGPKPAPAADGAPPAAAGPAGPAPAAPSAAAEEASGAAEDPLAAARADLLFELARAAAQGMVAVPPPPSAPPLPPPAPPPAPAAGDPPAPANLAPGAPIRIETGLDRAAGATPRIALTPTGGECPGDGDFDVAAWGGGGDAGAAIARGRSALVGEFDRPDPVAVLALARLYVHLGFGAEARALLAAFPVPGAEAAGVAALALIVDGAPAVPAAPFAGMAACDGAVALWAVLAAPALERGVPVATAAVLRAFSGLPPHLRRLLGRPLADRFLSTGDAETARALRDAAERAGAAGSPIGLVSARIALSRGQVEEAEALLADLAAGPGPEAAEALALLLESRLGRGAAIAPALAGAAEALAFELGESAVGARLAAVHARALAARGEHEAAFAALSRLAPGPATTALADALLVALAASAPEDVFLRLAFAALPGAGAPRHPPGGPEARRALARRLAEAGFGAEAQALLGPPDGLAGADRRLWARAALALGDGRAALAAVAGDDHAEAAGLRGAALARLGDHRGAAAAYAGADPALAAAARWRAGEAVAAADAPDLAASLAALARPAPEPRPSPASGPLATARALIADSAARRAAAAGLLAAYPPP